MAAAQELAPIVGTAAACEAIGVSRATLYRRRKPPAPRPKKPRPTPSRALCHAERQDVLDVLHSPDYVDLAPAQVYAALLTEGRYLCSTRTMYRILADENEVRERRQQLRHHVRPKPVLKATAPNQVWCWDITRLAGPPGQGFYLYTLLDLYSRFVVGWMLAHRQSGELARRLVEETCEKHGVRAGGLTLHSDRGSPMVAQPLVSLLAHLEIEASYSRPRVSNDNPHIESHFKTLKYRPGFPGRFDSYEAARDHCARFFPWYNEEHHHVALALLTPATVHHGRAGEILSARQAALDVAYESHPERFVHGHPTVPSPPETVWLNEPAAAVELAGH